MKSYTKFRVEAMRDHTAFAVHVKWLWFWLSGFVNTDYFGIEYKSEDEALQAIEKYKKRFTDV